MRFPVGRNKLPYQTFPVGNQEPIGEIPNLTLLGEILLLIPLGINEHILAKGHLCIPNLQIVKLKFLANWWAAICSLLGAYKEFPYICALEDTEEEAGKIDLDALTANINLAIRDGQEAPKPSEK